MHTYNLKLCVRNGDTARIRDKSGFWIAKNLVDIVDLISSTFKRNKKSREVKILAVLEYMFRGGCRETSKVLGAAFEPKAKSTVHGLAKELSEIKLA